MSEPGWSYFTWHRAALDLLATRDLSPTEFTVAMIVAAMSHLTYVRYVPGARRAVKRTRDRLSLSA